MKKNSIIAFVVITTILFVSCKSHPYDEEELGNGYYYLSALEAVDIGYMGGSMIYHSSKLNVFDDIIIKSGIVEVNKDKDFVLIGQNMQQKDLDISKTSYYFWIINKSENAVYGPLLFNDYLTKKKELRVSNKLSLRSEKSTLNIKNLNNRII